MASRSARGNASPALPVNPGSARSRRSRTATLLGRRPTDDIETAEVLFTRNIELIAQSSNLDPDKNSDPDELHAEDEAPLTFTESKPPPIFVSLVEDAVLQRGWRLEHPAVRGILVSPTAERIDAATLVTGSYAQPDLTVLRDIQSNTQRVAASNSRLDEGL